MISLPHAAVNPNTVMVQPLHTCNTDSAMSGTGRPYNLTRTAPVLFNILTINQWFCVTPIVRRWVKAVVDRLIMHTIGTYFAVFLWLLMVIFCSAVITISLFAVLDVARVLLGLCQTQQCEN